MALDPRGALQRGEGVLTRVFELPLADPETLPPDRRSQMLRYGLWRLSGRAPRFCRERGLAYNRWIETAADGLYLHGYWQSERYFGHIADDIRRDFSIAPESDAANIEMSQQIAQTPSISLHVRRGDYLTLDAHTLCSQAYYQAALAVVAEGLSDPTVFVFSDDPDWARANLPLTQRKVVVDLNGAETDYKDLRLMSLCQHNVIANSSFSWWAAWLNQNPTKRVAAPALWFANPKLRNPDILPDGWHAIAV